MTPSLIALPFGGKLKIKTPDSDVTKSIAVRCRICSQFQAPSMSAGYSAATGATAYFAVTTQADAKAIREGMTQEDTVTQLTTDKDGMCYEVKNIRETGDMFSCSVTRFAAVGSGWQ